MKFTKVVKAKLNSKEQLEKYMNKGYFLSLRGPGDTYLYKGDSLGVLVDSEIAELFVQENNLPIEFESAPLHLTVYRLEK